MIKQFLGVVGILVAVTGMIAGHYLFVDRASEKEAFAEIVTVTGFISPSLSTAFYEPNILGGRDRTSCFSTDAVNESYGICLC
ncbi:MAG: hypothetical protein ABXS91_05915 [Sulfurimonas sp.]